MNIILDTNVLIAIFDDTNALHRKAADMLRPYAEHALLVPVIVMAEGDVLASGTVEQVKTNPQVIEAYLGTGVKSKKERVKA